MKKLTIDDVVGCKPVTMAEMQELGMEHRLDYAGMNIYRKDDWMYAMKTKDTPPTETSTYVLYLSRYEAMSKYGGKNDNN